MRQVLVLQQQMLAQTSSVADANSVAPAANTDAHQAASALQKKKVMLAKRQTCKKYLLQMNVNIL